MKKYFYLLFPYLLLLSCHTATEYHIIIKNGEIYDGTGNEPVSADIGILDDQIVKIGDLSDNTANEVIDANGMIICPGFIDAHSHAGTGLDKEDRSDAKALLTQGLTTVVNHPDGGGPVDLEAQQRDLLLHGLGVNVIQLIGHGSIRKQIMGMDDRLATPEELEEMKLLVKKGMEAGAFGLSSGPFYTPGSYSDTKELIELSKVINPFDGIYTSHIRDESNYTIGLEAAVEEVITVAREADIIGIVTHIKALGPPVWGLSEKIVHNIERAKEQGVKVFADQYPYEASATGLGAALLPRWSQAGGNEAFLLRCQDPDTLFLIKEAMIDNLERRGGAERIQFRYYSPDSTLAGKKLSEVADIWKMEPVSAALKMLKKEQNIGIISYNMQEEDIHRFMSQPWTMTCSDGRYPVWGSGVPHPRSFGSFPRKLKKYVIDEEVVSLPFAIRSMTGLTADIMKIENRGYIREGYTADIIIIDLKKLADKATFLKPFQYAEGVEHNIVNGQIVIKNGSLMNVKAGKVVTRFAD